MRIELCTAAAFFLLIWSFSSSVSAVPTSITENHQQLLSQSGPRPGKVKQHMPISHASEAEDHISEIQKELFDALIIGGGPSGLQAGMSLGRIDRRAVIFDSGNYRNKATKHMHDVIALDGLAPSDFRSAAREQLTRYQSISYEPTTITAVQKFTANNRTFFAAKEESGKVWLGKYLVLAVGVQEQLKTTPGFEDLWGGSAFWCLWCDGFEHRDKRLVFLGTEHIVNDALIGAHLFANVSVFTDGITNFSFPSAFAERGIDIITKSIASYTRVHPWRDDSPIVITFTDGTSIEKDGIVTTNDKKPGSDFGEQLGVCHYDDNRVTAITDEKRRTSVEGVYAVGDVGSTVKNVAAAIAGAKSAAVDLIVRLAQEEGYGVVPEWEEVACDQMRRFTGRETMEEL